MLLAGAVNAAPWRLDPNLEPLLRSSELHQRYPSLDSGESLQNLLKDLAHQQPFLSLEALYIKDSGWLIVGEPAEYIKDIQIKLITRNLLNSLEVVRQKYLGRVDSDAMREKTVASVLEILNLAGYTNAKVHFEAKHEDEQLAYTINIDEGEPCLIRRVDLPFALPTGVSFEMDPGDICDSDRVTTALDQIEDDLRKAGYRQLTLQFNGFVYSPDKKYAEVQLSGNLGHKVVYKVRVDAERFLIDDLFTEGDFAGIDLSIASPDVMKGELQKYYLSKGYEDAEVHEPEKRELADGTLEYTYHIERGPQYLLSSVIFDGNTAFESRALLEAMGLYNFWNTPLLFDRDEINNGIDKLRNLYQEKGYWDVRIEAPRITRDRGTASVMVVVLINEGRPRTFAGMTLQGNTVFTNAELNELLGVEPGQNLNKSSLIAFEEKIRDQYIRQGYSYCSVHTKVTSTEELRDMPTRVFVSIDEGQRVKIGQISVVGLVRTDPKVVLRELEFKSGDWYQPEAISQSRSSLMSLGIFRSVQILPADRIAYLDQERVIDLVVEVYEGRAGTISFGPGYNLIHGLYFGSEFSYNNLGGTGRQVNLKAAVSQERSQYAISNPGNNIGRLFLGRKVGVGYVEPYLLGLPVNGSVSLTHKGEADEIWQISNVLDLALVYKPRFAGAGSYISPFYNLQLNRDEGTLAQQESLISTGDTRIARVGLRFKWDRRDQISWPTAGYLFNSELAWARYFLGGEYNFFKWDVSYNFYKGFAGNFVWVNGASLTSYERVERKAKDQAAVLPSSERLQAGGPTRVRGFHEQLGPYVRSGYGNEPIGGTRRVILKTELRYKLSDAMGLSVFIDNGNTFFSDDEMNKFRSEFDAAASPDERPTIEDNIGYRFSELVDHPDYLYSRHYLSYGTSFSVITPLGPAYFALAWPWHEPKSERCKRDGICFKRANDADVWFKRFETNFSIGSEF